MRFEGLPFVEVASRYSAYMLFPWIFFQAAIGNVPAVCMSTFYTCSAYWIHLRASKSLSLIEARRTSDLFCVLTATVLAHFVLSCGVKPWLASSMAVLPAVALLSNSRHAVWWTVLACVFHVGLTVSPGYDMSVVSPSLFPVIPASVAFYHRGFCINCSFVTILVFLFVFKRNSLQLMRVQRARLASLSHELRTPLHSILFNTQELAEQMGDVEEVQRLLKDSSLLVALTNDVLDVSKMETEEESEPNLSDVSTQHLLDALQQALRGTVSREVYAGHQCDDFVPIQLIDAHEVPPVLQLDLARVVQVTSNFVSNSIKYAGSHGPIVVSIRITNVVPPAQAANLSPEHQQYLIFEVIDHGPGPGATHNIFADAFTHMQKNVQGRQSLGLGLNICGRSALRMHGAVGHYAKSSEQYAFFLAVPLLEGRGSPPPQSMPQVMNPQHIRVLAVDDEPMNLRIIEKMLKRRGFAVETAPDLEQALDKVSFCDVLLLDYSLGEHVTGLDVLCEIKRQGKTLPRYGTIMVSAHAIPSVREAASEHGCVGYVTKPFKVQSLEHAISDAINGIPHW